jgi:hypothetical protein
VVLENDDDWAEVFGDLQVWVLPWLGGSRCGPGQFDLGMRMHGLMV